MRARALDGAECLTRVARTSSARAHNPTAAARRWSARARRAARPTRRYRRPRGAKTRRRESRETARPHLHGTIHWRRGSRERSPVDRSTMAGDDRLRRSTAGGRLVHGAVLSRPRGCSAHGADSSGAEAPRGEAPRPGDVRRSTCVTRTRTSEEAASGSPGTDRSMACDGRPRRSAADGWLVRAHEPRVSSECARGDDATQAPTTSPAHGAVALSPSARSPRARRQIHRAARAPLRAARAPSTAPEPTR